MHVKARGNNKVKSGGVMNMANYMISSIISIAFGCQVINFQSFCTNSASMNWAILEGIWALTPPNAVRSC